MLKEVSADKDEPAVFKTILCGTHHTFDQGFRCKKQMHSDLYYLSKLHKDKTLVKNVSTSHPEKAPSSICCRLGTLSSWVFSNLQSDFIF